MFTRGFHEILPKTNFDGHEKNSTGPKTNHRKTKKKERDNQNKILRVLLIHFCSIQGSLLPKNSECTVDNMGKIQEKWRKSEEKRKCKIKEKSVNYRQFLNWRYFKTLITNRILDTLKALPIIGDIPNFSSKIYWYLPDPNISYQTGWSLFLCTA